MASETKDLRRIRSCQNRPIRELVLAAISAGHRYRVTKSGVMILGEGGAATAHFTSSDHRAADNFRKSLKSIGITIEKRK